MAQWAQFNPANPVNITHHTSVYGDRTGANVVLKYANGRLIPNDTTRVYRDWKYEEVEWEAGYEPGSDVPDTWSQIDYVVGLDLVGGPDHETLPYYLTLLRCGTPGSEYTVFGLLYQGSNGKWRHWAQPHTEWRVWTDEDQVALVTSSHDFDTTKAGGRYYVGCTGDPICIKAEGETGASVYYDHWAARMRQAGASIWSVTRGKKIAILNKQTNADVGTIYYDGGYTTTEGGIPVGTSLFNIIGPSGGTPTFDDYVLCGWDVSLFWFTEVYEWEDETLESEPRLIGWATGPSEGFWFYHDHSAGVLANYGESDSIKYVSGDFSTYQHPKVNIWPAPGSEQMLFNRELDGESSYEYFYTLVEDGTPANSSTATGDPNYRLYHTRIGVAPTRSPSSGIATEIGNNVIRYYWDGFGSYTGIWNPSTGVYTPEDPLQDDLTGKLWMQGGYDPQDPYIEAADQWIEDEGPFNGISFKGEYTSHPGVPTTLYADPLYAEQEDERFSMEKVIFGEGAGTVRYDKLQSPSRYVVVEQFRDHLLSVPIDNPNVIEYSSPGNYANRPDPYRIIVNTERDDYIMAIKAYEQVGLIFTRSHVLNLNYLPSEAIYQDEEPIEVLCEGRTLTERQAIAHVSFANSHWITWMSNEGIMVSDGRVVYNACPDFNLHTVGFEMRAGDVDRMQLVNNIDDHRLELWLHGDQASQRWDFYYHDSLLIKQRYFRLRGPTTIGKHISHVAMVNVINPASTRRVRALLVGAGSTGLMVQTEAYSDDDLVCNYDKIWGRAPTDHVRLDGMILEVPGDSGFTYKSLVWTGGHLEDPGVDTAGREIVEMVLHSGARMAKGDFETSSGQWVQPGFTVEMGETITETWVGRTWMDLQGSEMTSA